MITHPLNRNDLPFITISGIVDGNFAISADGNVPFYIKNNFEGIIPQGTPIAQLIPFYRQNWFFKIKKGLVKKFITYIEKNVEKHKILFAFSKEIAKEDFTDVITTGILISRVAIEGNLPGIASKMAFIALTAP